ncbi:MAG: hypothetical protein R3F59_22395 [Myxococcota bacterium]
MTRTLPLAALALALAGCDPDEPAAPHASLARWSTETLGGMSTELLEPDAAAPTGGRRADHPPRLRPGGERDHHPHRPRRRRRGLRRGGRRPHRPERRRVFGC